MFTHAIDEIHGAMVLIQGPGSVDEKTFREGLGQLARLASTASRRLRIIVYILEGAEAVNPQQRKDILAAISAMPDGLCAFVTRSAVHRGTVTALIWLDPSLQGRHVATTSLDEACEWMQRTSGEDSTVLRRLNSQAERTFRRASYFGPPTTPSGST